MREREREFNGNMSEGSEKNIEPPKSEIMKEHEELKTLLESKPLTRGVLGMIEGVRNDANYYGNKVLETPGVGEGGVLQERFLRSHDGFVGDLSRIHYTLGKIENVGQMLAAAQGVEWQSLGGVQGHKMFTNAQKILEDARDELTSAKDTTIRKLDALMQMPYVQDAIHIEAESENEKFDKSRNPAI